MGDVSGEMNMYLKNFPQNFVVVYFFVCKYPNINQFSHLVETVEQRDGQQGWDMSVDETMQIVV